MPLPSQAPTSRWELAAETIALKIRWFGIVFGYFLVNLGENVPNRALLNGILALGAAYALLDTAYSLRGKVFLRKGPVLVSVMEALFIGLLCYYHTGLESPFRYYYVLSLVCCAIRHATWVTNLTWALHSASFLILFLVLPAEQQEPRALVLTLVLIGWVTWASSALALLLKQVGNYLSQVNAELEDHRGRLEERIAERTRELQEAQAHVIHQEKMAAFGLLAAGIAHEVGNPLTSISSVVQILQKRDQDPYTQEKLGQVNGQLKRIQTTLRELINFSRPASTIRHRVALSQVVEEALNIAKYYKRTKSRGIENHVLPDLPFVLGVRDQLVQAVLNLVLNAIDATDTGGTIRIEANAHDEDVALTVHDDGCGISADKASRLFQPYFTTKQHGTGLGLFVTRKLILEHGGTIDFHSEPGRGTTFRLNLPKMEAPVVPVRPQILEHLPSNVVIMPVGAGGQGSQAQ